MAQKSITLIIPTLNAAMHLGRLIGVLKAQSLPVEEIIIIDSASTDATVPIAQELGCTIMAVEKGSFNHGSTRSRAAAASTGDILIFMTQDALPCDDRFVEHLVQPFGDPAIAASFGRQVVDGLATPLEEFARGFNYPPVSEVKEKKDIERLGIKAFFFSNVCSAVRKDVFVKAGEFPRTVTNEDMILASRLILSGYKIAYQAQARVIHYHNYPPMKQLRRYFDIGVSLVESGILIHARPTGEGRRFFFEGAGYFITRRKPYWLFYFLIDTACRYTGYFLGLRYSAIPRAIRRLLSLHPFYFQ